MQPVEKTGGEGIARTHCTDDFRLGKLQAALNREVTCAVERTCTFWEMNDHPFVHPRIEQLLRGFLESRKIDSVFETNPDASGALQLKLVKDAVIDLLQCRQHDLRETLAVLAHHIDTGLETGFASACQNFRGDGTCLSIWLVETIEQQEIAEMKYPGRMRGEIKIRVIKKSVRAPVMKKSATTRGTNRHDIGVRGMRGGVHLHLSRVDTMLLALA